MKLVLAIISSDDAKAVVNNLTREGLHVTKISSTGGFLSSGNLTILLGVEDDRVDEVIALISKYSKSRKHQLPTAADTGTSLMGMSAEITVGGSTIFVLNIERFEKL